MSYPVFVGRVISRFRYQRRWTQEALAAKMQILGCDVTRDVIANMECGRTEPKYSQIMLFSYVFNVHISAFFPEPTEAFRNQPSSTYFVKQPARHLPVR